MNIGFCPFCSGRKGIKHENFPKNMRFGAVSLLRAVCVECGNTVPSSLTRFVNEKIIEQKVLEYKNRDLQNYVKPTFENTTWFIPEPDEPKPLEVHYEFGHDPKPLEELVGLMRENARETGEWFI